MNSILRLLVALVAGLLAFAASAVVVTVLYSPRIEFSLLVGLPVGIWIGFATAFLVGAGLWYRDVAGSGAPSGTARGVAWAAAAVAVDVVLVFALGVAWSLLLGGSGALGLLILGIPVTMVVAAVLGFVAARMLGGDGGDGEESPAPQ